MNFPQSLHESEEQLSRAAQPQLIAEPLEVSVVMPCLNEAETLALCIKQAAAALERSRLTGEIIVADNGSNDGSQELARQAGARLIDIEAKGYGSALRGGIAAARARSSSWLVPTTAMISAI